MRLSTVILGLCFLTVAFVLLPGAFVALNEDLGWPHWEMGTLAGVGWLLIVVGAGGAAYCSSLFRRLGSGTPVPIEPPVTLVEAGLFRFSRNPIYVADLLILLGIFLVRGEAALLLYVAIAAVAFHLFVVMHEEPLLAKRFGEAWTSYTGRVPRWLGRGAASRPSG